MIHYRSTTFALCMTAIAAAACSPAEKNTDAAPPPPANPAAQVAATPSAARVEIVAPAEGDSVSLPLTVKLSAIGVEVVKATGKAEPGKGHHHLVLDGDAPPDVAPLPGPPRVIHMGNGASEYKLDSLPKGPHRLIAMFASGDHVPLTTVGRDTVRFVVK